jgi:hypothetical protein
MYLPSTSSWPICPSLPASPTVTRCSQHTPAPLACLISRPEPARSASFPAWHHICYSPLSPRAMPDARVTSQRSTAPSATAAAPSSVATSAPAPTCGWCSSPRMPGTKQQAQQPLIIMRPQLQHPPPHWLPTLMTHPPPPNMPATSTRSCATHQRQHS